MSYNPLKHHRHSIRLKGYDYSQEGLYFLTLCCQDRAFLFGEIKNGEMNLNDAGNMIKSEWLKISDRFTNIKLHEYVIMPNHFHSIIEIVGAPLVGAQSENAGRNEEGREQGQPQGIAPTGIAPTEIAPTGIATTEIATTEIATTEIATTEIATTEIATTEIATTEIATTEIATTEIATTEIATTEIATTKKTVGDIMDAFKSITTVEYIRGVKSYNWRAFNKKLWQRNYWEHIIRDQKAYENISEYILNNPANWKCDSLKHPA